MKPLQELRKGILAASRMVGSDASIQLHSQLLSIVNELATPYQFAPYLEVCNILIVTLIVTSQFHYFNHTCCK